MSIPYRAKRTIGKSEVRARIKIYCDDTDAAIAYFNILKQEMKEKKIVDVICAPSTGASASDVIKHSTSPDSEDKGDKTFVLIDLDTKPNLANAQNQASAKKVTLLASMPCFEVWTLAHLQDTGEGFHDCQAVNARVRQKWKAEFGMEMGPKKAQADYEKLLPFRDEAIKRCKRRKPYSSPSWTEVWKAVEAIVS